MAYNHTISNELLDFDTLRKILYTKTTLTLSEESTNQIIKCRTYLDNRLDKDDSPVYGINTGFGSLCDVKISKPDLSTLQANLVKSHACGAGDEVSSEVVKLMLFLKIQSLSYGHSGVQLITVQRLIDLFNNEIYPVVFKQGSLGASGDLAPLAHLALPLIGEGEVRYKGSYVTSENLNKNFDWKPIELASKEGLALLNGTQFMSGFGSWVLVQSLRLSKWADIIGAISLEAFDGRLEPFDDLVHQVRRHKGQIKTADFFRDLLANSEIQVQFKEAVQDPYSFRCIPQVHGASKEFLDHGLQIIKKEINAVTDNPNIFPDEDKIISGGNFHGQILALAFDSIAIALHELGDISERRTYKLISGERGLPPFLVNNPGINSGFMIPQYTAASIVSQNKQLCTPASADSITSSNGQEDHVSMGANGATKCHRVTENLEKILAIELLNAAQAIEFRKPKKTSAKLEKLLTDYRKVVTFTENDEYLKPKIDASIEFLQNYNMDFIMKEII